MSKYKKIIEEAVKNGVGEDVMWKAVEVTDELIEELEEAHSELHCKYLRKMSEAIFGNHYNEEFAKHDVGRMFHTDAKNIKHYGHRWTPEDIERLTDGKTFPAGTTTWDKYVAYNAAWHDFTNEFDDDAVMQIAYMFFFKDEDYGGENKIWRYMGTK